MRLKKVCILFIALCFIGLPSVIQANPFLQEPREQKSVETASKTPSPEDVDPLVLVNNAFRVEYADAKKEALAKVGPLIIVGGNKVILVRNGTRTETQLLPPIYDSLKAIAHIPFAIFLTFNQSAGQKLADDRLAKLANYRKLIIGAKDSLSDRGFSDAQLARQQQIISGSLSFFDSAINHREVTKREVDDFANRMRPLLLANIDEAARAELSTLHSSIMTWRHQMPVNEWDALHVLIISAHMPRDGELTMQYFERLLNEPTEGRRIIFAEGLWEESRALDLLGTHLVDGSAGEAFFGDFMRMHRDLLGDAAKTYIETLKFDQ